MLRVRTTFTGMTSGPGLATHFFTGESQSIADDAAAAVGAFWDALEPRMVGYGTWAVESQVSQLDPATGELEAVYNVTPVSGTGSNGTQQLALATQGLLQLRTGAIVNGRQLRGRLYIPGPTEDGNTDGRPVAAYRDALSGAGASLIADAGNEWVVWSRPFAGSEGNPPREGTTVSVISAVAWNEWGIIRSRRD